MAQLGATSVIFSDEFSTNGPIDSSKWNFNVWMPPDGGGSFYGRTQQRQELPRASNGALHLLLDSFNPTDPDHATFVGSEAISKQQFSVGTGIAFEARAKHAQVQRGIVGGFFTFAGPASSHDEIDFEAMSNDPTRIQTNIYHNEPLYEGHPISYPLSSPQTEYHTYRIEWLPQAVRWLVDGKLVRTEKTLVPDKAMNLHLNIWAPPAAWPTGDAGLVAASSAQTSKTFSFDVDYVKVETLSTLFGSSGAERLVGTSANDWIHSGAGHDTAHGGAGDDRLIGGRGDDVLHGGNGADLLVGRAHDDELYGGRGADTLLGGAGDDYLHGGRGADELRGWTGADVFAFTSLSDSGLTDSRRDLIADFEPGVDTIDLSALDAIAGTPADDAFTFIGAADFGNVAGQLRAFAAGRHTMLEGDVDGDGAADFSILVKGSPTLAATDFAL